MSKTPQIRITASAPADDVQVAEWLKKQSNISMSLRILIKQFVATYGIIDVSCMPLTFGEAAKQTEAKPDKRDNADPDNQSKVRSMLDSLII